MKKILLLLLFLPVVFADYYLADSIVNITVLDNGLVNVAEDFTYSFNGCYNIVYADIPVIASKIISIIGYSDYAFVPFSELNGTHFIFEFRFNDSQCNKLVRTILEYNMSNAVDSYDDISSINFMFWGIGAPFTESLTANIKVPNSIIDYWIHNSAKEHSISSDNGIIFSQKNIGAGNWIETRVIFERLNNNSYSNLKSLEGLKIITGQENNYILLINVSNVSFALFIIIPFLLFLYIYILYGREENSEYFSEFDIPTNDSPAIVKSILDNNPSDSINSFIATIFDLARKKYLAIKGSENDIEIKILNDSAGLNEYENVVFLFLKKYQNNKIIRWNELKAKLLSVNNSADFQARLSSFNGLVVKSFDRKEYFDNEGNKKFLKYSIIAFLAFSIAGLCLDLMIFNIMPNYSSNLFICIIISSALFVVLNIINNKILGKWTVKGRIFEGKWKAFIRYLNDYSLLSKHAPQSIVVWDRFLVYAVALGVADNVLKVMKLKVADFRGSNLSAAYYSPAFYFSLRNTFISSTMRSAVYSDSHYSFGGGSGGFGGGHGGGFRGAR